MRPVAWKTALGAVVGGAMVLSVGSAAFATTADAGGVAVGIFGSDAGSNINSHMVAVSQGGCAKGTIAVSIGDPGRDCGAATFWSPEPGTGDAEGHVAVGVAGGDSNGKYVAVSDTGDAQATCTWFILDGCWVGAAVSGTGEARARDVAVSATGNATGPSQSHPTYVAVTGTGNAHGVYAVSGTGDATALDCCGAAVSGTRTARGAVAVAGGDASAANGGLVAVSATGNATGGSVATVGGAGAYSSGGVLAVSPTGEANGALVNVGWK